MPRMNEMTDHIIINYVSSVIYVLVRVANIVYTVMLTLCGY